jgi:hypothetical protein
LGNFESQIYIQDKKINLIYIFKSMLKKLFLIAICIFSIISIVQAETIQLPNQGTYNGDIKDGKPHGQGTLNYVDGEKYVGQWKNGLRDGKGTLIYVDGSKYVGEFKNNKIHGLGSFTSSSGSNYTGEYKEGKMDGQGTYTYPNGKKIIGTWVNDNFAQ